MFQRFVILNPHPLSFSIPILSIFPSPTLSHTDSHIALILVLITRAKLIRYEPYTAKGYNNDAGRSH